MIRQLIINTEQTVDDVFTHKGFLSDSKTTDAPTRMPNSIYTINPFLQYQKTLKTQEFYDKHIINCMIDANIDITKSIIICFNEYTKTVMTRLELRNFLLDNQGKFSYIEYRV